MIYVDLTGPEAVKSASSNLYVMNIVDDYSSHPWTFCLKLKSDVLSTLFGRIELRQKAENALASSTLMVAN